LPTILDYSHGDVGPCLWKLKTELDRLLELFGGTRKYESKPFVGHKYQMRVDMDPRWLGTGWDLYISVKSNLTANRVVELLTGGGLNMKIASPDRIEEVFALGHRGMVFRHEQAPPKVLPITRGETFFSIQRTPEEWPSVQASRKVAIRLSDKLIDGDLQDKRAVVLRAAGGQQQPVLQFTLYVIPPTI
jgi:type VI secretion system protein ImpJ